MVAAIGPEMAAGAEPVAPPLSSPARQPGSKRLTKSGVGSC